MITIRKANGERVPFDSQKLIDGLIRSGASLEEANKVLHHILNNISDGISTDKIFRLAQQHLRSISNITAGKYQLKKAVFDLGPGGYPFEKFVAKLLEFQGYNTRVNVIEHGRCVQHELDIVAENATKKIMIECKFHKDKGYKNDVKIPLYIHSRYLDMKAKWEAEGEKRIIEGMIVTNTRFSTDAEDYGKCIGLRLISWDFPTGSSLRNWVDESGLHPVTSLISINNAQKYKLMDGGVVLCREIAANPEVLDILGLPLSKSNRILKEAEMLSR